jgi:hypothetical protein
VIRPTNAQQLQEHLDTVLMRAKDGPRSSNAKRIVQQRLTASLENESTGIRRLELLLLFADDDDPNTTSGVSTKKNNVNRQRRQSTSNRSYRVSRHDHASSDLSKSALHSYLDLHLRYPNLSIIHIFLC